MRRLLVLLLAAGLAGCGGDTGRSRGPAATTASMPVSIRVTSPAFADGAAIPREFTCTGRGDSPPLSWAGLPSGTRSVAVVVDDPDAPGGTFVHWVLVGLRPDQHDLPAGTVPPGAVQARNSSGRVGWTPPCPPSGTHHYRFTVYALGRTVDLADGADPGSAVRAVAAAGIARGTLRGTVAAG